MSSSSEARTRRAIRAQVLREEARHATTAALLQVDLRPEGLARLDPARVDAAVEEGRDRGYQEGWAAGHAAATAEAQARALAEVDATRARVEALLSAAEAHLCRTVEGIATEAAGVAARAAELAGAIAEAVVGQELTTRTDRATVAAARALALAPDATEVVLRLHPDDAEALEVASLGDARSIRVVVDDALCPGDCVAEAGWTTVDARVAAALDRVRAALAADPALSSEACPAPGPEEAP